MGDDFVSVDEKRVEENVKVMSVLVICMELRCG
jgi:hypothetical protein